MTRPSVITIGNFDGVHVGHRAILSTARELARAGDAATGGSKSGGSKSGGSKSGDSKSGGSKSGGVNSGGVDSGGVDSGGAEVVVMTFDPHPNVTLDPANQPPRLCTLEQKLARLKQAGADKVLVLEPTPKVLGQAPEDFIQQVVDRHRPVALVEGGDFRFGRGRAGDVDLLKKLGEQHGFDVVIQPTRDVTLTDLSVVTVRSSVVRWLIGHGRVEDAHRCLGQPFSLTSEVVRGEQRGQAIGIPTVNLDLAALDEHMLPADGVYAGQAHWPGADRPHLAAISVGNKPSFGHVQLTIEAHLLDFDADLYGQQVTLEFTHWVRDQIRFPTPDALRQQLARDIEKVRTHQEPSVTCI